MGAVAADYARGGRDVKPANLLLRSLQGATDSSHCVLADFGLSGVAPLTGVAGTGTSPAVEQYFSDHPFNSCCACSPQPAAETHNRLADDKCAAEFMAPEQWGDDQYGAAVDMWSTGCCTTCS